MKEQVKDEIFLTKEITNKDIYKKLLHIENHSKGNKTSITWLFRWLSGVTTVLILIIGAMIK